MPSFVLLLCAIALPVWLIADKDEIPGVSASARQDASGKDSLLLIIKAKTSVLEKGTEGSATGEAIKSQLLPEAPITRS